jgi:hypothetical protein
VRFGSCGTKAEIRERLAAAWHQQSITAKEKIKIMTQSINYKLQGKEANNENVFTLNLVYKEILQTLRQ